MKTLGKTLLTITFVLMSSGAVLRADVGGARLEGGLSSNDESTVAALDTQYQAAVARNDAATMNRILADDFVLVTGMGKRFTKGDLLEAAREGKVTYEHQEDSSQTVRVWGDTAVVTALLWVKGSQEGKSFDYKLWFSDTYVRTTSGWRYVFGQASTRLPATP